MKYKHDCDDCIELGQANGHDLYYCPQRALDRPTLIARFGDNGPDYFTYNPSFFGAPASDLDGGLWIAAHERARAKGLKFEAGANAAPTTDDRPCCHLSSPAGEHSSTCWAEQVRVLQTENERLQSQLITTQRALESVGDGLVVRAQWKRDPSGGHHWIGYVAGHVSNAAAVALATRPAGTCWFWFNDTPSAIAPNDSVSGLVQRWQDWREAYRAGGPALLEKLRTWSLNWVG